MLDRKTMFRKHVLLHMIVLGQIADQRLEMNLRKIVTGVFPSVCQFIFLPELNLAVCPLVCLALVCLPEPPSVFRLGFCHSTCLVLPKFDISVEAPKCITSETSEVCINVEAK